MKSMSIENLISLRISCFLLNGLKHTNDDIKSFFSNALVSNSSYILRNINIIRNRINMRYSDFLLTNKSNLMRELSKTDSVRDWRVDFIEELLNVRDNQLECHLDRYESNVLLKYISTFR